MDCKFRAPRIWSNNELRKFSGLFYGEVVNVSGWRDEDKEGGLYREYFENGSEYWITNYKSEHRGFQGGNSRELYLNLESKLERDLIGRFDVVFNHTVLEHVFDVQQAFSNICAMSRDVVLIVVPFMQEQHAEYGDYWRFSPLAIKRMFEKNEMSLIYINCNDRANESIYVFAVGVKDATRWRRIADQRGNRIQGIESEMIGTKVITNSSALKLVYGIARRLVPRSAL